MGAEKTYTRPTHGIFRFIPDAWVPYAELMRLDRQSGFWVCYWHYLIGLGFAINIHPFSGDIDLKVLLFDAAHLALWATIFRGMACTWNDNLDQDFDRQVARCRVRPIPRGAVTTLQAHLFMAALIAAGAAILYPTGYNTLVHGVVDGTFFFFYPMLKRVTDFPQVELGFGLSYAIFLSASIIGKDPLAPLFDTSLELSDRVARVVDSPTAQSAAFLYVAGIIWCVIFDTIYAHQDYHDDLKAGVKGLAVRLGRQGTKPALYAAACVQVCSLAMAGKLAGFGEAYYAISCGGAGSLLMWMIRTVNLEDGKSCAWAFGRGSAYVGASISAGLMADFWIRKMEIDRIATGY